ncbi:MAG: C-type lectin domain-containing protein [Proteobacteria bacterium]|nr:C-type lectin domain-containing protein [Pseudomonadota bacterium]MCP4919009.1 C-type lectin domain-containing protein [Pseudomonadota bacterium]
MAAPLFVLPVLVSCLTKMETRPSGDSVLAGTTDSGSETCTVYADDDGDGFGAGAPIELDCDVVAVDQVENADDCDDAEAAVNPGATEVCNDVDDDCDGAVDDQDDSIDPSSQSSWYDDADGDGYGDPDADSIACTAPSGTVGDSGDCDDTDADVNPAGTEVCNGLDDDCDGDVDDDDNSVDSSTWSVFYGDADGDGYGDRDDLWRACSAPSGRVSDNTDCDDANADVNPGETEACNDVDDDCDGLVDDDDDSVAAATQSTWYDDADSDGYGDPDANSLACVAPAGTVADDTDCDDTSADVNPSETEVCNGLDDDCDGDVDDDDSSLDTSTQTTWYDDRDSDGYGDPDASSEACSAPSGTVSDDTDCDDTDADVNPAETEVCNSLDDDCDGDVDDDDSSLDTTTWLTFYDDLDGDGYGDPDTEDQACSVPSGTVSDATDCDDEKKFVNPAASEICNEIDDDCDGDVDDDDSSLDTSTWSTWYDDTDGDGFGDPDADSQACSATSGTVGNDSDCDDTDADVRPTADEVCNEIDDDCDGDVDDDDSSLDATTQSTWYEDADLDGYGDADVTTEACYEPSGYVSDDTDCDDGDVDVNPAASEECNGIDDDCDGSVDSDSVCPCDVERYDSHVYLFCESVVDWVDADIACSDETDFELAVIEDAAENSWATSTLLTYSSSHWWWIGFHDRNATSGQEPASGWEWVDGSTVSYDNFASGQPDNYWSNEDCGHLYPSGYWNDMDCDRSSWGGSQLYYICEATVSY